MNKLGIQKVLHLHLEEAKSKPKLNDTYLITEKYDGWYVFVEYTAKDGWSNIYSSSGREIPSLLHNTSFKSLPKPRHDCRIIAEAIIPGLTFPIINGILNRSKGDCQASDVVFYVHDIIYFNYPNLYNIERYNIVKELKDTSAVKVAPLLDASNSKKVWLGHANEVWNRGGEGIILKAEKGMYSPGRNSSLMKIKLEDSDIGECISLYYTTGEKGNRNINIRVRLASGIVIDVRVPKHEDIMFIEMDNNYILGQQVELKCMCILEDGKMREPRFVKVIK